MEAEKTYQNKVARTIQQIRSGEGTLEFADNRPIYNLIPPKSNVMIQRNVINDYRVYPNVYANHKLNSIRLCGDSYTSGVHQEIICVFVNSDLPSSHMYLRFSRNNESDTAMITPEARLDTLQEKNIDIDVDTAYNVFLGVHNKFPNYKQADCQIFAQSIYSYITGDEFIDIDDDFM